MNGTATYTRMGFRFLWIDQDARGYANSLRRKLRCTIARRKAIVRFNLPLLRKEGRQREYRYPMMEKRGRVYRY